MSIENGLNLSTATLLMDPAVSREQELERELLQLRNELEASNSKKVDLEDQLIELRAKLVLKQQTEEELKQQINVLSEFAINNGAHQKTIDLERMYEQMVYKDGRIVELNNVILEKERIIMDLQEMCREQSQVANAKSLAVQIVNKRLKELDSRKFQDASTQYSSSENGHQSKKFVSTANGREISPGRAVPQLKVNGNGSPPPVDPAAEDLSSYTTETYPDEMDFDHEWSASPSTSRQIRKHRKRVTFDFNATRKAATPEMAKIKQELNADTDDIQSQNLAQAVVDLSNENDQLRNTIADLERILNQQKGNKIAELEEKAETAQRERKNQALRMKAASQMRIKELEMKLLELKLSSSKEIENLKGANEVLKSSREWTLLENQRLSEQITTGKIKLDDLRGELDSSLGATTYYRQKLETEEHRTENLSSELRNSRSNIQQLTDEREFYQSEISQLKTALNAQEDLVSMLEGDLIVYEAHVGILQNTLGASKVEDRQIIRSKAFNAKLNALELEKKEISKRNNDERIRAKALNLKVRLLEEERDQLAMRLQQYEEESNRNVGDSLASTDDELMHDTKPTFNERAALDVGLEDSTMSEANVQSNSYIEPKIDIPDEFAVLQPPASSHSTIQTVNFIPDIEAGSGTLLNDDTEHRELPVELERMKDQRTEAIAILNHFMQEICDHLRSHSQKTLADQMQNDLRTYQVSPDVDLIIVTTQVRRFIDEVIQSLVYDCSTLRIEKDAIHEQYELTRYALHEAERVRQEVHEARLQMEANKLMIETDWKQLKNSLLIQDQVSKHANEHANKQEDFPNVFADVEDLPPLALKHSSTDEISNKSGQSSASSKTKLKQEIVKLQANNTQMSDEHSNTLSQLNDVQQQNNQLDQQIGSLKAELDHLRVDAELQKSSDKTLASLPEFCVLTYCLDDLRSNNKLIMEQRDEMEQKIVQLESTNHQITNEHSRILASLNEAQQQNGQLDSLVDSLRSELERIKIEAELSRNCLEDLRNNSSWQRQNQPASVARPQPQQQQPAQSLQNRLPLQQTPTSAFMPVERAVDNTAREALQYGALQQRGNDQFVATVDQQQAGPSSQQLNIDSNEVAILSDITQASQRVAHYLQSQTERFVNGQAVRPQFSSADSQTETTTIQHSLTQTEQAEDAREHIVYLEEMLQQKDLAINGLMGERDHLNRLYAELRAAYENLQIEISETKESMLHKEDELSLSTQQRNIESESFCATINELQQTINQLVGERDALQNELFNQRRLFDEEIESRKSIYQAQNTQETQNVELQEEISQLRHQIVQLSAESQYNSQLANERDYFRQQLDELQAHHEHEINVLKRDLGREQELPVQRETPLLYLNVDFSQQFDTLWPTTERFTQTEVSQSNGEMVEARDAVIQPQAFLEVAPKQGDSMPQFSAAAMTRVVQEQKEILQACIEESVQMESYMSHGVEHLMSLNSELELCAESIKAQVYALNQQIARELSEQTEQISQNPESSRFASNEQVEQLRNELIATRAENDQNLRRINEFQSTHQTMQRTYDELVERYSALQQSFEDLQQVNAIRAETEEKSTDALLDGSTIDRICDLNQTIEEMSAASTEARNQLSEYQKRLQSLQLLMSTQLNSTHDKLKELKSDEFVALKSSVVASISEFKMYLLRSFGQLQVALETTRSGDPNSMSIPDENSVRRELENTERVSRALVLCEKICKDIEEDSRLVNEQASSSACLETMLHKIHNHWRIKQEELAEKAKALNEQRNLSEMLEGRLNEAEARLNFIQSRAIDSSGVPPSSLLSANDQQQSSSSLHLAIMAARLTTKQCDNDALFRCNSELAKTNVDLHAQVEHLQDCVQRVSDELDAVISISSNSRQSSLASLNVKQSDEQEKSSPPGSLRRRVESEESTQLPIVNEEEPVETTLIATLSNNTSNEHITQVSVQIKDLASSSSTVLLVKSKPAKTKSTKKAVVKKVEKAPEPIIEPTIEEDAWGWNEDNENAEEPAIEDNKQIDEKPIQEEDQEDWGWGEEPMVELPTEKPVEKPIEEKSKEWGWNEDDKQIDENEPVEEDDNWDEW